MESNSGNGGRGSGRLRTNFIVLQGLVIPSKSYPGTSWDFFETLQDKFVIPSKSYPDSFVVTAGNVNEENVKKYIEDQKEHHKKDDFKISEY